jgi:CHAT domain-containing protein/tetratricopeptide (TPR) repeat protein
VQCFFSAQAQSSRSQEGQEIEAAIYAVYEDLFYSQPDSAFEVLEKAAKRAEAEKLWDLQINALLQAAWCADYHTRIDTLQYYLNQTEQLIHQHAPALDTLDPTGSIGTDVAYTRGSFYYSSGDFSSAIAAFSKIVEPQALSQAQDSLLVNDVFVYLGSAYYRLQNYQKALDHYQIANQWLPTTSEESGYNYTYYLALNDLYQAQSYYASAKYNNQPEAYEQGKQLAYRALDYLLPKKNTPRFQNPIRSGVNMLAAIFQDQQQYDSALQYLSLSVSLQNEENTILIDTYNKLGAIYTQMQRYDQALDSFGKSIQLADRLLPAKHYQRAIVYMLTGKTRAKQGEWNNALVEYQKALSQLIIEFNPSTNYLENPPYQDTGAKKELLEVLSYKAEALWGLYQQQPADTKPLLSALEIYHQIGDILDGMREGFPSIEYKQFVASHFFGIYEKAIQVAYEMHRQQPEATERYLAEAFYFAEKSKSILLLEATQEIQAQNFGGVPASLLEQEREYTRKRSLLQQQLSQVTEPDSEQANKLRQRLLATQDAHRKLLTQLEVQYPDYYSLRHETNVTTLANVQTSLADGTVLLSYFYGDSTLFAFGISSKKVVLKPVPDLSAIQQKLVRLLNFTSQYDWQVVKDRSIVSRWANDGYNLYQQLIDDVLDSLSINPSKLVIIPDGQLGYLPFDVLLTDSVASAAPNQFATLPYVLKKYPIRYEYSATLYARQNLPQTELSVRYAYTGFAPEYESPPLLAKNELTRSANSTETFSDLLYNKEEVKQVANFFNSRVFLGEEATEQAFREFALESRMLHLSMHAFAHDEDPMYSGLVFSQPAETEEDNFLYAYELYNMQLRANLAVLSACETGIGQLARGEGIMSLGRAFKYAGCPNVAMSLWKVNDRTTQSIVQAFFKNLADGTDKDEALQQAKLSFLNEAKGPLAHPYYWASLVLIGDDLPLADSTWSLPLVLFVGLGLFIALVAFFLTRSRRTKPSN